MRLINFLLTATMLVFLLINIVNAQWIEQTSNLPGNGRAFTFSAIDEDTVWAMGIAQSFSGPYRGFAITHDGGDNWTGNTITAPASFSNSGFHAIDGSTAWMSMSDASGATSGGIFKTGDGGNSWVQQTSAFPGSGGFPNGVYFFDAGNGLAMGDPNGGYFEIYTTTDGGDNWIRVPQPNIPDPLASEVGQTSNCYGAGDSTVWFGTDQGRVFRTTDRGASWEAYDTGLGSYLIVCAFRNADTGLATAVFTTNIAKTTDGGASWTLLSTPAPFTGLITFVPGTISTYFICEPYTSLGAGSAYTSDGGASWTVVDNLSHWPAFFVNPATGWSGNNYSGVIYKWVGPAVAIDNLSHNLPQEIILSQNYPNPFNPVTTIEFSLPAASEVSLVIYNVTGQEVERLIERRSMAPGQYRVEWAPRALPSGIYFYRIEAGEFRETKRMLLVK